MATTPSAVIALDVGDKRVGVAVASLAARLPRPLATLVRGEDFFQSLERLVRAEDAGTLVVGLPRGLQGQETAQTVTTEDFITELQAYFSLPVHLQDEAVTSVRAEEELKARGKDYVKGDIDALAAAYILEDWLRDHQEAA